MYESFFALNFFEWGTFHTGAKLMKMFGLKKIHRQFFLLLPYYFKAKIKKKIMILVFRNGKNGLRGKAIEFIFLIWSKILKEKLHQLTDS